MERRKGRGPVVQRASRAIVELMRGGWIITWPVRVDGLGLLRAITAMRSRSNLDPIVENRKVAVGSSLRSMTVLPHGNLKAIECGCLL